MRYVVKYRKPGQVEGARLFGVEKGASEAVIQAAGEEVAGVGAEVISVEPNDGTALGERKVAPADLTGASWYDDRLDVTFTIGAKVGRDDDDGGDLYEVAASDRPHPTRMYESALRQYLAAAGVVR